MRVRVSMYSSSDHLRGTSLIMSIHRLHLSCLYDLLITQLVWKWKLGTTCGLWEIPIIRRSHSGLNYTHKRLVKHMRLALGTTDACGYTDDKQSRGEQTLGQRYRQRLPIVRQWEWQIHVQAYIASQYDKSSACHIRSISTVQKKKGKEDDELLHHTLSCGAKRLKDKLRGMTLDIMRFTVDTERVPGVLRRKSSSEDIHHPALLHRIYTLFGYVSRDS